jgi:hypothetical protein
VTYKVPIYEMAMPVSADFPRSSTSSQPPGCMVSFVSYGERLSKRRVFEGNSLRAGLPRWSSRSRLLADFKTRRKSQITSTPNKPVALRRLSQILKEVTIVSRWRIYAASFRGCSFKFHSHCPLRRTFNCLMLSRS